jgi:hypothetical protein
MTRSRLRYANLESNRHRVVAGSGRTLPVQLISSKWRRGKRQRISSPVKRQRSRIFSSLHRRRLKRRRLYRYTGRWRCSRCCRACARALRRALGAIGAIAAAAAPMAAAAAAARYTTRGRTALAAQRNFGSASPPPSAGQKISLTPHNLPEPSLCAWHLRQGFQTGFRVPQ